MKRKGMISVSSLDLQARPSDAGGTAVAEQTGTVARERKPDRFVAAMDIERIHESPTNPRKTFNEIPELADDMKAHGVTQALLVRLWPEDCPTQWNDGEHVQIVCGARRIRAARHAGLTTVPVIVRDLTDAEVLEIQIAENDQREDLTPLEQAEGYNALLKAGYDVQRIAAKTGRNAAYVHGRLSLLKLLPDFLEMVRKEQLPLAQASLIARHGEREQKELLECSDFSSVKYQPAGRYYPPTVAALKDRLNRMQCSLKSAPFDLADAELLPAAGACQGCPHRTGENPGLFADVDPKKDMCLSPACYTAKTKALLKRKEKELREAGTAYVKIAVGLSEWDSDRSKVQKSGVLLPEQYESGKAAKGAPAEELRTALVTYGNSIGKVMTVRVKPEVAQTLSHRGTVKAEERPATTTRMSGRIDDTETVAKREELKKLNAAIGKLFWSQVMAVSSLSRDTWLAMLREVAAETLLGEHDDEVITEAYGWPSDWQGQRKAAEKFIAKASGEELQILIVRLLASRVLPYDTCPDWKTNEHIGLCKILAIDPKAIEKQAKKQIADEEKQAAKRTDWYARMVECKDADEARELFMEHQKAVMEILDRHKIKTKFGTLQSIEVIGFGCVVPADWIRVTADLRKVNPVAADELQALIEQGKNIHHSEVWTRLLKSERFDSKASPVPAQPLADGGQGGKPVAAAVTAEKPHKQGKGKKHAAGGDQAGTAKDDQGSHGKQDTPAAAPAKLPASIETYVRELHNLQDQKLNRAELEDAGKFARHCAEYMLGRRNDDPDNRKWDTTLLVRQLIAEGIQDAAWEEGIDLERTTVPDDASDVEAQELDDKPVAPPKPNRPRPVG